MHDAWPETVNGWELAAEPGTSGVPEAELTFTLTDPVPDVSEARSAPDTGIERGAELIAAVAPRWYPVVADRPGERWFVHLRV